MATREKMSLSEQGMEQPYTSPYAGQQPSQPYLGQQYPGQQYSGQQYSGQPIQTVYIQNMPTQSRRYENYNGKLSVIFGASLIVMTTVAICLNVAGVIVQRGRLGHDSIVPVMFLGFPSAWSGIFVSI